MSYLDEQLVFTDTEIYYIRSSSGQKIEVMMDWEDNLMSASAAYACENGGDILEIGFGMGISAGYIQSHSINSHTICENHPDVIPKAQAWASDKPNVTIVTSSWYDVRNELGTFDGIFYDTFGDPNFRHLSASLPTLSNQNCKITWWNSTAGPNNPYNIDVTDYELIECTPDTNHYYRHSKYYLPKYQYT